MAQCSHVPKFGNWENDNIAYTTYFDNARKEKTGVMINPNDPQENPEAFMYGRGEGELSFGHRASPSVSEEQKHNHNRYSRDRRNQKSIASESATGSDKSNSDRSAAFRRQKSNRSKEQGGGAHHHREASVPKFGDWDETDPNSGEGFTVIFNRVKEGKQSASLPPQPQQTYHSPTISNKPPSSSSSSSFFYRFKFCCCRF